MTGGREGGYVTAPFVVVVAVTLVGFVGVVNLFALHYARGVLQVAVEEGVRQGVSTRSSSACAARADGVIASGLGGLGSGVGVPACSVGPDAVTATVDATFDAWLPALPDATSTVTARALLP